MIPLFKTCYSLKGRSILTLEEPVKTEDFDKNGPQSVFQIAQDHDIKDLFLVEDSMTGFLKAYKTSKELKLNLRFGLRTDCVNDLSSQDNKEEPKSLHKIILMAKNTDGVHSLIKISSKANVEFGGKVDGKLLREYWNGLYLWIPYYDSFLFKNWLTLSTCVPDFSFTEPVFLRESNGLPFEMILDNALEAFKDKEQIKVKSIYYRNRDDFLAWQTFKILADRSFSSNRSLEKPNLEHCCSREFSMESWLETRNV